jgi:hypothetical protein
MVWAPRDFDTLISDPKEALDVFDFEPVAQKNVPPAHFGYVVTGIDDEVTLRANRDGFLKFQLRPRRLVDVSTIDMTVEIFGAKYDNPIVIAPTGSNRARLSPGRRGSCRQCGKGGQPPTDSLKRGDNIDRRRNCSTWRTGVVPGLPTEMGSHPSAYRARRKSRIPSGGRHRGWWCADELGDLSSFAAHRYAAMRQLPWQWAA